MLVKGEIPFLRMLIPLIIGIVIGLWCPGRELFQWSLIAMTLGLALLILLNTLYKNYHLYRRRWLIGILVQTIILLAGCILTIRSSQKFNADYFTDFPSDALIVTVRNEPQLSGDILRFETTVEQTISYKSIKAVSGKLLVAIKTDSLNPIKLNYGDQLLIRSQYTEVDPPFNPSEFNFKKYLSNKQIYRQSFITQQQVMLLKHHSGDRVIAFALRLRKQLVEKFYKYLENQDAAALASTLILGYRVSLSKDVVSAYSKTGTMHVLSVSGMHVAIVFIVLAFLMRPLRNNQQLRYLSAFVIISSIWFYALITGFSPSVCRAAMMLSFVVLGKTLNKNLNTYNLLAISAFFLLIYNPYNLVDVGFQLSYLAVIGLVSLQPKIHYLLFIKNRFLDSLWSYSALSISAQLATFPISVYYFHQFPVYFLVSNLIVVLPVALIMYVGIVFLFIPWSVLLYPLGSFLNALIVYTNNILFYIEDLPFASISGIWINTFQYILIYLIIICIIWAVFSAKKAGVYFCLVFILLLSLSITYKTVQDGRINELIFYTLRKNSAVAYIQNRKAYLISDLLNDEKTHSFSIKPGLDSRGVSEIRNINLDSTFSNEHITVSPNYIQFENYKIIRWNKQMDDLIFRKKLSSDVVLLSENPRCAVKDIAANVTFSLLLIDATNPDYKINQWKFDAEKLKIPVWVLKKRPAYVLKETIRKGY